MQQFAYYMFVMFQTRHDTSSDLDDDDKDTVSKHSHRIAEEYSKSLPRYEVLKYSMKQTFKARRQHVLAGMSTSAIFEQFPVFDDANWVSAHML